MANMCQSCSMPLNKDPQGGGSEADGSRSTRYCSLCYDEGGFRQPDFSVNEMQEHCCTQLRKKGMPGFMASAFTRELPKLERWKNS